MFPVATTESFDELWEHYQRARLLYPDKLRALESQLDRVRIGWPAVMSAPTTLFQVQIERVDGRITSSLGTFRDIDGAYVVQHAASERNPLGMLRCLRNVLAVMEDDPTSRHIVFHSRPKNGWPSRLIQAFSDHHPASLTDLTCRNYLLCDPRSVAAPMSSTVESIRDWAFDEQVEPLAVAAIGTIRTRTSGIASPAGELSELSSLYARYGVRRSRIALVSRRDGAVAGVAVVQMSSVPLNLSCLDIRTEIIVHPDAPDRSAIVGELASEAIRAAAAQGATVMTLLADDIDVDAAVAAGFRTTGRQYRTAIWTRESGEGWPGMHDAFADMYQSLVARSAT